MKKTLKLKKIIQEEGKYYDSDRKTLSKLRRISRNIRG